MTGPARACRRPSGRGSCAAVLLVLWAVPGTAAERYLAASVDDEGQLRLRTKTGREIVVRKDRDQVGVDRVAISDDGRSVAWLALYPNCCTSYPIPLKLLLRTAGNVRAFTGNGLPIWRWHFTAGGTQVAFSQETVHGGLGAHYELREVATGRLVAEFTPEVAPDNQVLPGQGVPEWVAALRASR